MGLKNNNKKPPSPKEKNKEASPDILYCSTNRTRMAEGFLKVDPCAGSKPTHSGWFQKCLEPRCHSPKEGHLRRQAINSIHPERVRTWRDDPLWLKDVSIRILGHPATHVRQPQNTHTHNYWGARENYIFKIYFTGYWVTR